MHIHMYTVKKIIKPRHSYFIVDRAGGGGSLSFMGLVGLFSLIPSFSLIQKGVQIMIGLQLNIISEACLVL